MSTAVIYDLERFEGIDLNQASVWLDHDSVSHSIDDMMPGERLRALADLDQLADRAHLGPALQRSQLYRALLNIPTPLETPSREEAG